MHVPVCYLDSLGRCREQIQINFLSVLVQLVVVKNGKINVEKGFERALLNR